VTAPPVLHCPRPNARLWITNEYQHDGSRQAWPWAREPFVHRPVYFISVVILYRKYTGARDNDRLARGQAGRPAYLRAALRPERRQLAGPALTHDCDGQEQGRSRAASRVEGAGKNLSSRAYTHSYARAVERAFVRGYKSEVQIKPDRSRSMDMDSVTEPPMSNT
jgi:hypothetical protein